MTTPLPKEYAWLTKEGAPKMLVEALRLYGTKEFPGNADNPEIIGWAKELGIDKVYSADSIPWCGTYMCIVAKRAGKEPGKGMDWVKLLWAWNWAKFGIPQDIAMLGDVLTFGLIPGHGHVTLYVGEDKTTYHCLGGNQADAVNISRYLKTAIHSISRPVFATGQPANVRRVWLSTTGAPRDGSTL